ncbi:hypothetical protein [Marinobacter sp. CA1]|uniref:hypothetical protein n=1 Tax=Marinobacter sp. CA1 TaxID=2817656 RepID=UPI001D06F203|nr:hypothetical protein [Marinobacter sp. CA1]UDL05109.1 hypothetical protein J2887_21050 [Marinobacter sp. CA1]
MDPANLLKIDSLDNEWRDKDTVMLHACFQLLKDCVEKERLLDGNTDWQADERQRETYRELKALYDWWCGYADNRFPDDADYALETQMLERLVRIRWAMWT